MASTLITLPLAGTGLATEAKQDTGNTSLASIDTKLSSQATAAKQDTGNTSLASVDTKLSSQATAANQATGNTSLASIDTKMSAQSTAAAQTDGTQKTQVTVMPSYATRVDEYSASVTYVGKAVAGTLDAGLVWQIMRITVTGTVTAIEWADGNLNFDNQWSTRTGLSYS